MFNDFLQFIRDQQLYQGGDTILLALSGGVDSMVLFDLFLNAEIQVTAAHCNFQLRGKESDEDAEFINEKTNQEGIPCLIKNFRTSEYANKKGISIQMAARELRYSWFEELCASGGYDLIATAHHRDDSIETVIFNMIKGTGLRGLTGIGIKSGKIIRPLLFAGKNDILDYARKNKINYRKDRSNEETKYHRNYIRKNIIPLFENINPGFKNRFMQSISRLADTQEALDQMILGRSDEYKKETANDIYLKKSWFNHVTVLYEVLKDYGFNYDQSRQIFSGFNSETGRVFYTDEYVLDIDRDHLIITPFKNLNEISLVWDSEESSLQIPGGLLHKEMHHDISNLAGDDPHIEYFDLSKISFPLKVRNWQEGDWFIPLGMEGKKKVSDFMIDKKIPVNLKKRILVLVSGESIIWVVGHRLDERFRITPDTGEILKISYQPLHDQSI